MLTTLKRTISWIAAAKTNPRVWVQAVHFLIAYSTILTTAHYHGHIALTAAAIVIVSLWLETVFDVKEEGDPFWPNGATDFAFYCLGTLVGLVIVRT